MEYFITTVRDSKYLFWRYKMCVYREVTIQVKQKEVMKKLEEMSKQGINLTLWFYQKVLEHKV